MDISPSPPQLLKNTKHSKKTPSFKNYPAQRKPDINQRKPVTVQNVTNQMDSDPDEYDDISEMMGFD